MENASKALLMAGGILIGILLLALMVTLFAGAGSLSKSYDEAKQSEAIQNFNSNFTKYLGKDITIHEVVTICNFASIENNKVKEVVVTNGKIDTDIAKDLDKANDEYVDNYKDQKKKVEFVYKLEISEYDDNGYVSKINFTDRRIKTTDFSSEE